jgi:hypothetical protein
MNYAYADPPYPGQSKRHYADHPDYAGEIDHQALIRTLEQDYPDGWALSTNSPSLALLLPMFTVKVRIGAWVKPFASFKPGVNPAFAWEPVIFYGGRKRARSEPTVRDWVSANITLKKGTHGAKPETFSTWLFHLLGMEPGDTLDDLFPGSGAVTRAWESYLHQGSLIP